MELENPVGARCDSCSPRQSDWLVAVAGTLVLLDTFDAPIWAVVGDAHAVAGIPLARLPLLAVAAGALVLLRGERRAALASVRASWLVWPVIALAFASTGWSDQPRKTVFWATGLVATTLFGVGLSRRFSPRAQAVLLAGVTSAIALASAAAAAVFAHNRLGIGGYWSGVYFHKNLLGRVVALGVVASAVTLANRHWQRAGLGALLVCGAVLMATQSVASMLSVGIALAAFACLRAARVYRRATYAIVGGGACATIAIVLLLIGTKSGLQLLARRATFSDRTVIWRLVAAGAAEDPWFGHGYGAFWGGPAGEKTVAELGKPINHAHDGGLDLYAELGIAGLVVLVIPAAVAVASAAEHALQPAPAACLWPATYVVFFLASNVAESALLRHKLYWALFVAVLCHLQLGPGMQSRAEPVPLTALGGTEPVAPSAPAA